MGQLLSFLYVVSVVPLRCKGRGECCDTLQSTSVELAQRPGLPLKRLSTPELCVGLLIIVWWRQLGTYCLDGNRTQVAKSWPRNVKGWELISRPIFWIEKLESCRRAQAHASWGGSEDLDFFYSLAASSPPAKKTQLWIIHGWCLQSTPSCQSTLIIIN